MGSAYEDRPLNQQSQQLNREGDYLGIFLRGAA